MKKRKHCESLHCVALEGYSIQKEGWIVCLSHFALYSRFSDRREIRRNKENVGGRWEEAEGIPVDGRLDCAIGDQWRSRRNEQCGLKHES